MNQPELVIGLVTPIGTNTSELASRVATALSMYNYIPIVIKLTDLLPGTIRGITPIGEGEDQRVRRLIQAGDEFCRIHTGEDPEGDPAALARLAIKEIRQKRTGLFRQNGDNRPVQQLTDGYPRAAYILHSLKRPAEIMLLRQIYDSQFVLIGSQSTLKHREENLLSRPMAATTPEERQETVAELIQLDADEDDAIGQKVNDAYPLADFFLRDNQAERPIDLLFGQPLAPDIGEYAMYVARASRARSLSASRKVGATIVAEGAVIATGYNDVPEGLAART